MTLLKAAPLASPIAEAVAAKLLVLACWGLRVACGLRQRATRPRPSFRLRGRQHARRSGHIKATFLFTGNTTGLSVGRIYTERSHTRPLHYPLAFALSPTPGLENGGLRRCVVQR